MILTLSKLLRFQEFQVFQYQYLEAPTVGTPALEALQRVVLLHHSPMDNGSCTRRFENMSLFFNTQRRTTALALGIFADHLSELLHWTPMEHTPSQGNSESPATSATTTTGE
jgi:hypothetical protein